MTQYRNDIKLGEYEENKHIQRSKVTDVIDDYELDLDNLEKGSTDLNLILITIRKKKQPRRCTE